MKKVSILLSVYKPREDYLREQLLSLDAQDWPACELLVWNDDPSVPLDEALFRECVTRFPVRLYSGEENLGYTRAYERLTELCDGEYLTYCDQDDVWLPGKISGSVRALEEAGAQAVVCDRALIDGEGRVLCESVRHTSRMHNETWPSCADITVPDTFLCYGNGLCILMRTEIAKMALPFCRTTGHDKWVLLCAAAHGKVAVYDEPVVHYRRWGKNVSGVLKNVDSKDDYYHERVEHARGIVEEFAKRWPDDPHVPEMRRALEAQISRNPFRIWSVRRSIPDLYKYQILLVLCPAPLFTLGKRILQRGAGRK